MGFFVGQIGSIENISMARKRALSLVIPIITWNRVAAPDINHFGAKQGDIGLENGYFGGGNRSQQVGLARPQRTVCRLNFVCINESQQVWLLWH